MRTDCSFNWPEICRIVGPCLRPGGTVLTERALEISSLSPGSRIADIGCGAGGTLAYLERTRAYSLVGLDCSGSLLEEAASRLGSSQLVRGRAEALPFDKASFDAFFCECVLSLLDDRITVLHEFSRVLKEGGYLMISDVFDQGCSGQGRSEGQSQQCRTNGLLTKDDLLGLLTSLGFSLILWEEHERTLKEFAARMILAGERLPEPWGCRQEVKKTGRAGISYFLLVARKLGATFLVNETR